MPYFVIFHGNLLHNRLYLMCWRSGCIGMYVLTNLVVYLWKQRFRFKFNTADMVELYRCLFSDPPGRSSMVPGWWHGTSTQGKMILSSHDFDDWKQRSLCPGNVIFFFLTWGGSRNPRHGYSLCRSSVCIHCADPGRLRKIFCVDLPL